MESPNEEEEEALPNPKGFAGALLWRIELLAKPLLKPFSQNSDPISIFEEDLEPLKRMLARIRAALKDSHKVVLRGEFQKLWVSELWELESRAEDIIEELEFLALRKEKLREYKSELRRKRISSKRMREEHEVGIFFSASSVKNLSRKIENLRELHRQLAFDREALCLREEDVESLRPCCSQRPPTSSLMTQNFYGRRDDVNTVIKSLMSDDDHRHGISVIPIDGMGGMGKTALAQRVFSDEAVMSHFDERIWICVSDGLDLLKVMKSIREALRMETCCPSELDLVQQDVVRQLRGKRLLLVLDDLWNHEHWERHWTSLQVCLRAASKGSKIVVTTRNSKIAGSVRHHHLKSLSEDECWSIFKQNAFHGELSSIDPNLIHIAKEINRRCKGLPLAAKVLGCLLNGVLSEEKWRRVLEELWSHEKCQNEILPDLRLSYDNLPMHLQRCFLYCSLFPKGYVFNKDQLSRLWVAQGFGELNGNRKLKETIGEYFDELASRSFFQQAQSSGSHGKRYVMHDVFDELAQSIAEFNCIRADDGILCEINRKTQHSSLILDNCHSENGVQFELTHALDLRSLLFIRKNQDTERIFHFVVPRFDFLQSLRALDLSYTDVDQLPTSIGSLIHLRYLGLRSTRIKRLPESICGLFKLQTLDLKQCRYLNELPEGVKFLSDLQLLQLPSLYRTERLADLQTLAVVIECDQTDHSNVVEGKDMPSHLQRSENFKFKEVVDGHNMELGGFTEVGNVCCNSLAAASSSLIRNE